MSQQQDKHDDPEENLSRPEKAPLAAHLKGTEASKASLVDMTALIRSLQRVEGNPDCFRKSLGDCGEIKCLWRLYCLSCRP